MREIQQKRLIRYLLMVLALVLVVLTFSPVILQPGKIEPKFLSLPYTLWSSMLITIILVVLTYLVSKFQDKE